MDHLLAVARRLLCVVVGMVGLLGGVVLASSVEDDPGSGLAGGMALAAASTQLDQIQSKVEEINKTTHETWDLAYWADQNAKKATAAANAAKASADTANATAGAARDQAKGAWTSADQAWNSADGAWKEAGLAKTQATGAWKSSDQAWNSADHAWLSADAATAQAKGAWTEATGAWTEATGAKTAAEGVARTVSDTVVPALQKILAGIGGGSGDNAEVVAAVNALAVKADALLAGQTAAGNEADEQTELMKLMQNTLSVQADTGTVIQGMVDLIRTLMQKANDGLDGVRGGQQEEITGLAAIRAAVGALEDVVQVATTSIVQAVSAVSDSIDALAAGAARIGSEWGEPLLEQAREAARILGRTQGEQCGAAASLALSQQALCSPKWSQLQDMKDQIHKLLEGILGGTSKRDQSDSQTRDRIVELGGKVEQVAGINRDLRDTLHGVAGGVTGLGDAPGSGLGFGAASMPRLTAWQTQFACVQAAFGGAPGHGSVGCSGAVVDLGDYASFDLFAAACDAIPSWALSALYYGVSAIVILGALFLAFRNIMSAIGFRSYGLGGES